MECMELLGSQTAADMQPDFSAVSRLCFAPLSASGTMATVMTTMHAIFSNRLIISIQHKGLALNFKNRRRSSLSHSCLQDPDMLY